MEKNIVLIGFMGTGKTSIGMRLARTLKREFVDTDREIETLTGMNVFTIFKKYGEVRFRSEEELLTKKLALRKRLVIATGGGMVLNPHNLEILSENGILICLQADPATILNRVKKKKQARPLLGKEVTLERIVELLEARKDFYSRANIVVNTSGLSPDEIVAEILTKLRGVNDETAKS
ncbi:MAG: shikimate kinase [Chitinophagales bacterium]